LNYAGDTIIYHRLDIYLLQVQKPTYPAVILIYGSAWFGNNLKGADLATLGKALLYAGFAVVTSNYRSSMDAKFPAQKHDIKAVIRFIRANAEKYQIDTSFIGITGSSSGGHLAALAGTSGFFKQYTVDSTTEDIESDGGMIFKMILQLVWTGARSHIRKLTTPSTPALGHPEQITVKSGQDFGLDVSGTTDSDGDNLSYLWFHYPEAGSYKKLIKIDSAENARGVWVIAPEVDKIKTAHFILKVTDKGEPALSRYKRVIVSISPD
jgi:hypothetical protein